MAAMIGDRSFDRQSVQDEPEGVQEVVHVDLRLIQPGAHFENYKRMLPLLNYVELVGGGGVAPPLRCYVTAALHVVMAEAPAAWIGSFPTGLPAPRTSPHTKHRRLDSYAPPM